MAINTRYDTDMRRRGVRSPRYPFGADLYGGRLFVLNNAAPVVPGETLMDARVRIQGRTGLTATDLTPLYWDTWLVYVPNRLADPNWETVARDGGSLPAATVIDTVYGVRAAHADDTAVMPKNGLKAGGYAAIARAPGFTVPGGEQFALPAGNDGARTAATTAAALHRLPAVDLGIEVPVATEEEAGSLRMPVNFGDDGSAEGTGDNADSVTLFLDDLRQAIAQEAYDREQATGRAGLHADPYRAYLAGYGVDMGQNDMGDLIEWPEVWGHQRMTVWPSRVVDDGSAAIRSRFLLKMDWQLKGRRMAREHGILWLVGGLRRPVLHDGKVGTLVDYMATREEWVPPLMDYPPYIEPPAGLDAADEVAWMWEHGADTAGIDVREALHRGESQIVTTAAAKGAAGAGHLWHTTSDTSSDALEVAAEIGISSDAGQAAGTVGSVSGLFTPRFRSAIQRPPKPVDAR